MPEVIRIPVIDVSRSTSDEVVLIVVAPQQGFPRYDPLLLASAQQHVERTLNKRWEVCYYCLPKEYHTETGAYVDRTSVLCALATRRFAAVFVCGDSVSPEMREIVVAAWYNKLPLLDGTGVESLAERFLKRFRRKSFDQAHSA